MNLVKLIAEEIAGIIIVAISFSVFPVKIAILVSALAVYGMLYPMYEYMAGE